jgi:hypothetical protein
VPAPSSIRMRHTDHFPGYTSSTLAQLRTFIGGRVCDVADPVGHDQSSVVGDIRSGRTCAGPPAGRARAYASAADRAPGAMWPDALSPRNT